MTSTTSHWLQQFQSTSLPTLPHITDEFIQLCRQSDTSLDKLFHLASQDPALSFRLFAKASSICRERETVIRQVDHAISALGLGFLQGQSQELTPLKINAKISFIDQEYCRSLEQALLTTPPSPAWPRSAPRPAGCAGTATSTWSSWTTCSSCRPRPRAGSRKSRS